MGIDVSELRSDEEVFTWLDPDTGKTVHFAVSRLRHMVDKFDLYHEVGILPNYAQWLVECRGVDVAHAMALTEKELEEPSILLKMEGHHLLVDGTHRVYRLAVEGHLTSNAYILDRATWEDFVIEGLPDTMSEEEVKSLKADSLPQRKERKSHG